MRKFRIQLQGEIGERTICANDIPDILIKKNPYNGIFYFVKTNNVTFDQIVNLTSSYKNYIHEYRVATIKEI